MFSNGNGISLSDIAAVCGNRDGFGGNGDGWWILVILWALWGNNGMGGPFGARSGGAADGYILTTDFANIERKLDGVNNGICSLGYDQLAQMNGINTNVANGFAGVNNAICTLGYQNAQLISGVQSQLADCCCQNREAIAQVRYDMATDTAGVTTAIDRAVQNIMTNCNNNYRALHDENVAARMEAKDETIAMLREQLNRRDINESNANQTNQIIAALRPSPIPAFNVPNPWAGCGCGYN